MSNYQDRLNRLEEIRSLEDGWFDGKGKRLSSEAESKSKIIISALNDLNEYGYSLYPTPSGGAVFEWEKIVLEIETMSDGNVVFYTEHSGEPLEIVFDNPSEEILKYLVNMMIEI